MARKKWEMILPVFVCLIICSLLAACQPRVYLMPTPEALRSGKHDPFRVKPAWDTGNRVMVGYATNRLPLGLKNERGYITLFDNTLRMGVSSIRIGEDELSNDALHAQSLSAQRDNNLPLFLENTQELSVLDSARYDGGLAAEQRRFFDLINQALANSLDKDLTVYVHGANSNFYRATAQAAQYCHFTGRHSVVLVFAWPSAESLLRYAVDVNNAAKTVPVFADFLELLARHTQARNIDVLAYSAGAQVLSPALVELSQRFAGEDSQHIKQRLRLGEIYFAAPDIDFKRFMEQLADFIKLAQHVTVAINPSDSVLSIAQSHHGVSRAGSPDPTELTEEETRWVEQASRKLPFDILWVNPETIPDLGRGSHSFWYSNPWVSTDVLVQLLFQARPEERGLQVYDTEGDARVWLFPQDYPVQSSEAIKRLQSKQERETQP